MTGSFPLQRHAPNTVSRAGARAEGWRQARIAQDVEPISTPVLEAGTVASSDGDEDARVSKVGVTSPSRKGFRSRRRHVWCAHCVWSGLHSYLEQYRCSVRVGGAVWTGDARCVMPTSWQVACCA